jgi:two-component system OmpR family sensor kinase
MRELVEELLLLAHLDEGRPLARGRVDLNEIVVDAISASRAVAPDRPIALRASDVVAVEGDAGRLRQAVDNLLANIRMHTPPGTATTIELRADGQARLIVRDDGPGMSPEQATHVFERFYRADPSRSRASGGAGLGMAIVDALVRAHRGTISIDTAPGHGVTITISLPLAADDADVATAEADAAPAEAATADVVTADAAARRER